jgi:iron-sulfur cluster repair protein YtfE (RIC family)
MHATQENQLLFPSIVRDQVLEQHQTLRTMFLRALDATTLSLRGDGPDLADLGTLALDLRQRFRAHLTFEEHMLVPVLAQLDLWGPERVQALREEHARQRAELETIVEGIKSDWDVARLAVVLRSLVTDLLRDMEEEEDGCLNARLLRDDVVSVDQATG